MTDKQTINSSGPSFVSLLAILFIALKLTGVIAWSWWWVLSPIWIAFALLCTVLFVMLCLIMAADKEKAKLWSKDKK
jgi:membrane protein YdbS with pleckstrin-like domain